MTEEIELVEGSNNIFEDLGFADTEVMKLKAKLAAELLRIMRKRELTVRAAAKLAGVDHSDIVKIRNVDLDRFKLDRLLKIVTRLDKNVRVEITRVDESEAA
jgi:predicted XRE-type DNA-binding protein